MPDIYVGVGSNIDPEANIAKAVEMLRNECGAIESTHLKQLVVAGGVGANKELRQRLREAGEQRGFRVFYPRPAFCTDNGAMIAYAGWCRRETVVTGAPCIVARPRWPLDELG